MAFLKNLGHDMRNALLSQISNDPGLKILLEEDKDVVGALDNLAKETGETFKHLNKFGEGQPIDLKDIVELQAFYAMEVSQHFIQMSKSYDTYRERLKDIKKMQDELFEMEKKLTTVDDKIKKDQKAKKSTDMLEREAADLKTSIADFAAKFEVQKRKLYQQALAAQYKGWQELGHKLLVVGSFGLNLSDVVPQGAPQPQTIAHLTKPIKTDYLTAVESAKNGVLPSLPGHTATPAPFHAIPLPLQQHVPAGIQNPGQPWTPPTAAPAGAPQQYGNPPQPWTPPSDATPPGAPQQYGNPPQPWTPPSDATPPGAPQQYGNPPQPWTPPVGTDPAPQAPNWGQ